MKAIGLALVSCSLLVTACVVGDDTTPPPEEDEGADLGDGEIAPDAASGCTQMSTVIMYSESTNALTLPNAFAAAPDPCTRYYVYLPAITSDKTMPRATVANVHALGPNFHAMAEFHWAAWHDWVAESPGTRDWELAGKVFRSRMEQAGYEVGDNWAINEFPSTTRTGELDVWTHERNAVKGLAIGDGTRTVKGVVFTSGMSQSLTNTGPMKANLENWFQQDAYWADMNRYVASFAYEVYADPHLNCVQGSNVTADADHVTAFLEHLPRLAQAGGARSQVAASYLQHHYVPLVGAAYGATIGYGDNRISVADFVKFQRLQIYATHVNAAHVGYPGRRVGIAWAPKDATTDQENYMASVIAGSVTRAYPANKFYNLGKYACSIAGSLDGCGCTVAGSYNDAWDTFETW